MAFAFQLLTHLLSLTRICIQVTYELLLGFGSKIPDFAVKVISGAIISEYRCG